MRSLLNKASAIDFDNSTALPVVKASSNVMRQNGAWRSKGAWHGDSEKTTVVLSGVPKTLGTYGHGEVGEYGNCTHQCPQAPQAQHGSGVPALLFRLQPNCMAWGAFQ